MSEYISTYGTPNLFSGFGALGATASGALMDEKRKRQQLITERHKLWFQLEKLSGQKVRKLPDNWRVHLANGGPAPTIGMVEDVKTLQHWNNVARGQIAAAKKAIAALPKTPVATQIKTTMTPAMAPPGPAVEPPGPVEPAAMTAADAGGKPIMLYAGIGVVVLGGLWLAMRKKK